MSVWRKKDEDTRRVQFQTYYCQHCHADRMHARQGEEPWRCAYCQTALAAAIHQPVRVPANQRKRAI